MGERGSGCSWIWRLALILQLVGGIHSWGQEGHYATCKIAEEYLSEDAKAAVKELLPNSSHEDFASLCSWADEIRFHYHWSGALHYVDTPDFTCNYDYCRDCHDLHGHRDACVTGAIFNYTKQLEDTFQDSPMITTFNKTEALLFLLHFIGDVHQPLHVAFTGDEGGNTIIVHWYRRKANLHHVWDSMIIETALKAFYGNDLLFMIESINRNITNVWTNDLSDWKDCKSNQTVCPDPYASESIRLACKYAYKNATPGSTLHDEYFLSRLPIVEKRLAQGGVRLAATLNRIFSSRKKLAQA
ncbi:hypothetical protein MLD38_039865 [Melastoma candidum]|uniref:Uncharacterized protein n=1 Tax=Melastoma candidum TaxID=119954 RepID=A0ACB9L3V9_9MYRT|nr:hypothetical protein MLD38_039865 [Melastoma candidum]